MRVPSLKRYPGRVRRSCAGSARPTARVVRWAPVAQASHRHRKRERIGPNKRLAETVLQERQVEIAERMMVSAGVPCAPLTCSKSLPASTRSLHNTIAETAPST